MGDSRDPREKESFSREADADQTAERFLEELRNPLQLTEKPGSINAEDQTRLDRLSNNHELAEKFPPPTAEKLKDLRTGLEKELSTEVPVMGDDGKPTNLYEKLMRSDKLDAAQKERVLNALAEVNDAYYRIEAAVPADSDAKGYQDVNWKHTRGEVDQVLDSAGRMGLSPVETENALLASIFSDSVKFGKGDPHNNPNFLVHNIDGAKAAAEVLPRYFDLSVPGNLERIEAITHAVREHQIGPPEFMSDMTRLALEGRLGKKPGVPLPAEQQALVDSIVQKIAKPMESKLVTDAKGASRIAFTDAERGLLEQIGIKDWFVPDARNSWYRTSQAVINGDSLINYATPDGWAKIAAIRGPGKEPWFQDKTVLDSLESTQKSYNDAYQVLSEEAKPLADAGLQRTRGAIDRVKGEMELWFTGLETQEFKIPRTPEGKIPFWNAPLKYATKDQPLTEFEQSQFEFAKQIREEMVRRLRAQQGVFESVPVAVTVPPVDRKAEGREVGRETTERSSRAEKAPIEETSEFYESQGETRGRESALKVEAKEAAGRVTVVADKSVQPELARTLEKYNKDQAFLELLEREIAETKDQTEKERLKEELEKYRKLPEAERARVREMAAEDALRTSRSTGGAGKTIGRVLAVGGTIIAIGMLADLLISDCNSNSQRSGPPVKPTFRGN